MLFDSSIRKELARSFGATLVVLVTVVMTMMLIRTLGQASKGSVSPSDVMLVMGFTVLGQLPTILSLSLFIAVVGTLSRMYRPRKTQQGPQQADEATATGKPDDHFAVTVHAR